MAKATAKYPIRTKGNPMATTAGAYSPTTAKIFRTFFTSYLPLAATIMRQGFQFVKHVKEKT